MSETKIPSEDYITYNSIKSFIAGLFRFLFKCLWLCKAVLRKAWLFLLLGMFIGGLAGFLFHSVSPPRYKVQLLVHYSELNAKEFDDVLVQLQNLIVTGSRSTLASELKIPYSEAENISHIEGLSINDESLLKDTASARFFKIALSLRSPLAVDSNLEQALVNYINNLPYLKKLKETKMRLYRDRLVFIDSEMGKLDTLKTEYVHSLATFKAPTTFYNNAVDPAAIYRQSYRLDSLKEITLQELSMDEKTLLTVSGLKSTEAPSVSKSASILKWIIAGFLIVFLFRLFAEVNRRLNVD